MNDAGGRSLARVAACTGRVGRNVHLLSVGEAQPAGKEAAPQDGI